MANWIRITSLCVIIAGGLLCSCGGSSNNSKSTTGSVTFAGNLSSLPQTRGFDLTREDDTASPLQDATVMAGDGSGKTDQDGNFSFGASEGSYDSSAPEITIDIAGFTLSLILPGVPASARSITANMQRDADGNITATSVKAGNIQTNSEGEQTPIGYNTTCHCDDGFGPVSEDTICADTGEKPTNCESVPIYPGDETCQNAANILCGCADVDCPSGDDDDDDSACEDNAETAAQCIVDNEADVCQYFADLAEDPAQLVTDDYENGYADNCL